ncbi:MarR family winged helix-turn-helix transcriptional regulator [Stackebrandtia soli]|uniref:MarR family winged helix-turn-helix transcriptional regulator n=1 Tax=Stackebrandtia soli TaxID=1892856 RepID=UPI0039EA183E
MTRQLADEVNRLLRDLVLLLRRTHVTADASPQQLAVLGSLSDRDCRMSALADEHGVRLPTMTAQINRLERDGLVARRGDAADARVVVVTLTDAGRTTLADGRARRVEALEHRLATLTDDDRARIAAALPALSRLAAAEPTGGER